MTSGQIVFEYYHSIANDFLAHLAHIPGVFEIEDIHQMRVSVKKLRAMYDFLEEATEGNMSARQNYNCLKPLFKTAGRIRENQIHEALLIEYQASPDIMNAFQLLVDQTDISDKAQLEMSIRNFDHEAFKNAETSIRAYCSNEPDASIIIHIDRFIQNFLSLIRDILDQEINNKSVHKIRIRLKTIKPLLGLAWQITGSHYTEENFQKLEETEKYIGAWHDQVLLIDVLDVIMRSPNLSRGPLLEKIRDLMLLVEEKSQNLLIQIQESVTQTINGMNNRSFSN